MPITITKITNDIGALAGYRVSAFGGAYYFENINEAVNCVEFLTICYS